MQPGLPVPSAVIGTVDPSWDMLARFHVRIVSGKRARQVTGSTKCATGQVKGKEPSHAPTWATLKSN